MPMDTSAQFVKSAELLRQGKIEGFTILRTAVDWAKATGRRSVDEAVSRLAVGEGPCGSDMSNVKSPVGRRPWSRNVMKDQTGSLRGRSVALLVLAGLLAGLLAGVPAAAEPPASFRDRAWTWGYVIPGKLPGPVPFVFPDGSSCSLETAADTGRRCGVDGAKGGTGAPGAIDKPRRCCAIQVHDAAGAAKFTRCQKHPNIVGAMIDFYPWKRRKGYSRRSSWRLHHASANPPLFPLSATPPRRMSSDCAVLHVVNLYRMERGRHVAEHGDR